MKKITKKFLVQKMQEMQERDNPEFGEDLSRLASEITMFSVKYGIEFEVKAKMKEVNKGRGLKLD